MHDDLLKTLVREEIKKLIQDDALFDRESIATDGTGLVLPSKGDVKDIDSSASSYMAKPQLYRIVKNSTEIYNMLEDNEEIDDWMENYIAQSDHMINSVYGGLDYKRSAPLSLGKSLGPVVSYED